MLMDETIQQRENEAYRSMRTRAVALLFRALALTSLITALLLLLANHPVRLARAASKTAVVTMTDKPPTYVPAELTVRVGTTVLWKNTGTTLHDVTTDSSAAQNKNDVALPTGAKAFDSGFMPPGATWSYTFTVPGHYRYACIPHEKDHMLGEITVTK